MALDATYRPKTYRRAGGDEQVIASGGSLIVEDGGTVDLSDLTQPVSLGTKANVVGSGITIPATDDWGMFRVFTDDNGANIGVSVRGVQSRTLLTVDQSAGTIRALQGHLKAINLVDFATGIYTPLQGYLELAGTHISSAGATVSCIDASLEIGTALTAIGEVFGVHIETTGSGTISGAGTCAGIGITKASGAASWPVGLYISPLAVTTAISVGSKANVVGSGVVIPSTDDFGAVRIFTDDNGANIADSVRGLQSRTLLTISQSAGTIRAMQGQLKAIDGVNFATGVYTPVQGYIELVGSQTVASTAVLSCFDASIEIGTALTATGYVAGFSAELTGSGTCGAGLDCGFLVKNASGSAVWTYGLYVEDSAVDNGIKVGTCTTGITIGTATTGITLTGTYTNGIDLSSGVLTEGSDNALFSIGSYSAAKSVALATDGFYQPFQINLLSSANPTSETIMSGSYIKTATNGNQANMNLVGETIRVTVNGNVAQAYGVQCHLTVNAATVATSNANVCAGSFKTVVSGAVDLNATTNVMLLTFENASGTVSGEKNMMTLDPTAAVNNIFQIYNTANATYFFECAAKAGFANGASKATQSGASTGSLAVLIGGTPYYIPYFT